MLARTEGKWLEDMPSGERPMAAPGAAESSTWVSLSPPLDFLFFFFELDLDLDCLPPRLPPLAPSSLDESSAAAYRLPGSALLECGLCAAGYASVTSPPAPLPPVELPLDGNTVATAGTAPRCLCSSASMSRLLGVPVGDKKSVDCICAPPVACGIEVSTLSPVEAAGLVAATACRCWLLEFHARKYWWSTVHG